MKTVQAYGMFNARTASPKLTQWVNRMNLPYDADQYRPHKAAVPSAVTEFEPLVAIIGTGDKKKSVFFDKYFHLLQGKLRDVRFAFIEVRRGTDVPRDAVMHLLEQGSILVFYGSRKCVTTDLCWTFTCRPKWLKKVGKTFYIMTISAITPALCVLVLCSFWFSN
jgi:hypothetical protein